MCRVSLKDKIRKEIGLGWCNIDGAFWPELLGIIVKTSSLCSVQATKEVAELAAGMQRLQAFIYVSTCYVNAHHPKGSHIEEAFYPLVMRSSERTVDHAELASRLAALPPGRAEKAVSPLVIITVTLCCRGIMMSSRFSLQEESLRHKRGSENLHWALGRGADPAHHCKRLPHKIERSVLHPPACDMQAQAVLKEVGLPNSYTMTKHMAEGLVADMHAAGALPAAIVRPSIIGCCAQDPAPGYIGNAAGLTSAILAVVSGEHIPIASTLHV